MKKKMNKHPFHPPGYDPELRCPLCATGFLNWYPNRDWYKCTSCNEEWPASELCAPTIKRREAVEATRRKYS